MTYEGIRLTTRRPGPEHRHLGALCAIPECRYASEETQMLGLRGSASYSDACLQVPAKITAGPYLDARVSLMQIRLRYASIQLDDLHIGIAHCSVLLEHKSLVK